MSDRAKFSLLGADCAWITHHPEVGRREADFRVVILRPCLANLTVGDFSLIWIASESPTIWTNPTYHATAPKL
jgi:hypothetical protein